MLVALFGLASDQLSDYPEVNGNGRTFTIIAPVHDAMRVTERRRERLGCWELTEAALSSVAFSWAMIVGGYKMWERMKKRGSLGALKVGHRILLSVFFFSVFILLYRVVSAHGYPRKSAQTSITADAVPWSSPGGQLTKIVGSVLQ